MQCRSGKGAAPGSATIETLGHLAFGIGGHGGRLLDGWSNPENGFTWAVGQQARFVLPVPAARPGSGRLLLELDLNPFAPPGRLLGQQLTVLAGGIAIARERIVGEGTVGFIVPEAAWPADGALVVTLLMPDACRPADAGFGTDGRVLGFMLRSAALRRIEALPVPRRILPPLDLPHGRSAEHLGEAFLRLTGMPPSDLLRGFESLGHNCEFGVVQRHFGAEPLGLLRFSGITLPDLLTGLACGFAGAGQQLEVLLADGTRREFMVRDSAPPVSRCTRCVSKDETDAARPCVPAAQATHLRFPGSDVFAERLCAVPTSCSCSSAGGQTLDAQARPLLARLRAHGPNALLFVEPRATPTRPARSRSSNTACSAAGPTGRPRRRRSATRQPCSLARQLRQYALRLWDAQRSLSRA